jgi:asparagine synthetase B (glutamine-hydrolysing)
VATADGGRVALGFAGEHGSVATVQGSVACFEGELLDPSDGLSGAAELLAGHAESGESLEPPEGAYAAALWDARRRRLLLITDRYASRPLYVARIGTALVAAGELKALLSAGLKPTLGLQGWAEFLAYEHLLPGSSPLEGVDVVPAGTTVIHDERAFRARARWRYRLEPIEDADEVSLLEALDVALTGAVTRRVDAETGVAVSGGLDSRCLAGIVGRTGSDALATTYGAPGSEDLTIGVRVARLAGLRHTVLPLESGYIARGAESVVWLSEGRIRCFHAHHLALRRLRPRGVRHLLMGLSGDDVMRAAAAPSWNGDWDEFVARAHHIRARCLSDELLDVVLTSRFAEVLRGRARGGLAEALSRDEGEPGQRFAQLLFRNTQAPRLYDDHVTTRDPFSDHAVVDLARRLPRRLREHGRLERALVRRFRPLDRLPTTKDGVPPRLTGRRAMLAGQLVRVRRRTRSTLWELTGLDAARRASGLGDYATDLRRSGSGLLDVLVEPRTLSRGQLREDPVRRLISETMSGRKSHTQVLGVLLTLELFQRQFVDGEGFRE